MPEATPDFYHSAPPRKHNVWSAWKASLMQPVPEPSGVKSTPNGHLWLSIFPPYKRASLSAEETDGKALSVPTYSILEM